jgi:hypothetical protein
MGWVSKQEDDVTRADTAAADAAEVHSSILESRSKASLIKRKADKGRIPSGDEIRSAMLQERLAAKQAIAARNAKRSPSARKIVELEREVENLKRLLGKQADELRKLRAQK